MKVQNYFILSLGVTLGGLLSGCATSNSALRIPASDSPVRSFPSPPPTVIRLPLKFMFPKISAVPQDFPEWLDQQVHKVDSLLKTKVKDMKWPLPGMRGISDLQAIPNLWEEAQEPIFIDKDIWLVMDPTGLSSGLAQVDPKNPLKWETVLEVTAFPHVVFGEKPMVEKKRLPPFALYKPGPTGFHAIGNATISFKEANLILADPKSGLVNRLIPGTGNYRLRIKKVELYGARGKVVAQVLIEYYPLVNFEGNPSQMTIYFKGTPYFNTTKQVFYLKDLDFDVKTGDFLMQVANWILKSDIRNALQKKAHIPLGKKLKQLKGRLNEVLNRPLGKHDRLEAQVNSFRIMDAFVDQDGIQIQMSLDGTARLDIFSQ